MKKYISLFLLSIVLFSSLPLSTFAAQTVYVDYYYAPWRDEYRADHTGLGAGEFHYFRTHFTAADTTEYTLDLNYYTGIMYLTCNGVYKFQFVDEFDNVLAESMEMVTTSIVNPACDSYPEQSGTDDLGASATDNGNGGYDLNWSDIPGADTYEIWKDGVKAGDTTDNTFGIN